MLRPCLRRSHPIPPDSVSPAIPVLVTTPSGAARPCSCVAPSRSAKVAPPCARTVRALASTWTSRIADRSTTSPSSASASPATPCPPPRTPSGSSCATAKRTAAATSSGPAQRAIRAGRRSIMPFQIERASS